MQITLRHHRGLMGFVVSIYREWHQDRPTYRYFGAHLRHGLPWWKPSFNLIIDHSGRLYAHLGYIVLWQDVLPIRKGEAHDLLRHMRTTRIRRG